MKGKRVNSKKKGAAGEREWSKFCREQGFEVRRTQQYAGGTDESADCVGLPYIHQEVKRVERLNIDEAIEQAELDILKSMYGKEKEGSFLDKMSISMVKSLGKMPIVAHRKNGRQWLVTMYAEDWFKVYKEFFASMELMKK